LLNFEILKEETSLPEKKLSNKKYNRFEPPVSHNRNSFMWWKRKIISGRQLHLDSIVQGYQLPS